MRTRVCFTSFVFLWQFLLVPSVPPDESRGPYYIWKNPPGGPNHSSLIQVIANPERFDGKRIVVRGFVHLQFEDMALYLEKESADYLIPGNAVWLVFPAGFLSDADKQKFHRQYVMIEGVFRKDNRGHRGVFPGAITEINGIKIIKKIEPN